MSSYNVQEASAPFMLLQGCSTVMPWEQGFLLSRRLEATALQVSAGSLQFYPDEALVFGPSWSVANCTPTRGALCLSASVALMGTTPVTTPRDLAALLPHSALLRAINSAACTSDATGRVVGDSDVYTVSMCDLVEGAFRFVLRHSEDGDRVLWIRDNTGVVENTVLALIAVYTATSLAQNILSLISKSPASLPAPAWSQGLSVLACIVSVAVLLAMCEGHREYYIAQPDVDLYHVLLLFLVADVLLLLLKQTGPRDSSRNFGHQVGLSTVVLLLVSLRLYNTFNTPFVLVLLGLFGARALCKLLQHIHDGAAGQARDLNLASVVLDLCVWCCLLAYSLAQHSSVQDELAVAVNATVAMLLGLAMSVLIVDGA